MRFLPSFLILAAMATSAVAASSGGKLVGVTGAVAAAERSLSARAIGAELETREGRLVYVIDLVRGATLHRATVDARSGRLLTTAKPRIANWVAAWFGKDRIRAAGRAEPLGARLAALERQSAGEVKEVEFDMHEGRAVYEVEIATAAGVGEVRIDALTGRRLELAYDD